MRGLVGKGGQERIAQELPSLESGGNDALQQIMEFAQAPYDTIWSSLQEWKEPARQCAQALSGQPTKNMARTVRPPRNGVL